MTGAHRACADPTRGRAQDAQAVRALLRDRARGTPRHYRPALAAARAERPDSRSPSAVSGGTGPFLVRACTGRQGQVAVKRGAPRCADAPSGRRTPRAPRPGPACRRDGAAGAGAVRRAGGQRQDHDAGRPRRLAGGRRRRSGVRHRGRVQQAGRGGADGAAGCGARAARSGRRRDVGARPDVPRAGPGDAGGGRRVPSSRWWTGTRCCGSCSRVRRRRTGAGWTSPSRG